MTDSVIDQHSKMQTLIDQSENLLKRTEESWKDSSLDAKFDKQLGLCLDFLSENKTANSDWVKVLLVCADLRYSQLLALHLRTSSLNTPSVEPSRGDDLTLDQIVPTDDASLSAVARLLHSAMVSAMVERGEVEACFKVALEVVQAQRQRLGLSKLSSKHLHFAEFIRADDAFVYVDWLDEIYSRPTNTTEPWCKLELNALRFH